MSQRKNNDQVHVIQSVFGDIDDFSPYGIATNLFCGRLVRDRFNYLNKYSHINWYSEPDSIPRPKSTNIHDLVNQTACELIKQGSISVQWSGGVDSTTVLLSLIANRIDKNDLVVLLDQNSIVEYPKLYLWLQKQRYNLQIVKDWRHSLAICKTDMITNGWCADQLFGSIFFHEAPDQYDKTVDQLLQTCRLYQHMKLPKTDREYAVDVFKQMGKDLFNVDINIAAELGWMINFCLKWTWVSSFNELYLANTDNQFKTKVFYDTSQFQSWAVNNFLQIHQNNIYGSESVYYKQPLKQYCYKVFKDDNFLYNKTKKPSWNAALTDRLGKSLETTETVTIKTTKGYDIYELPISGDYNQLSQQRNELLSNYLKND